MKADGFVAKGSVEHDRRLAVLRVLREGNFFLDALDKGVEPSTENLSKALSNLANAMGVVSRR